MTTDPQPWGRWATFGLGLVALLAGQTAALVALTWWYGRSSGICRISPATASRSPSSSSCRRRSSGAAGAVCQRAAPAPPTISGLTWPRRGEVVFGVAAMVALIVVGNVLSWLLGRNLVTPFQLDIYRTAGAAGWLLWLWLAVVVVTPIGEEILFRGFLFRGWLRSPRDAWPVIVVTALLWALDPCAIRLVRDRAGFHLRPAARLAALGHRLDAS